MKSTQEDSIVIILCQEWITNFKTVNISTEITEETVQYLKEHLLI